MGCKSVQAKAAVSGMEASQTSIAAALLQATHTYRPQRTHLQLQALHQQAVCAHGSFQALALWLVWGGHTPAELRHTAAAVNVACRWCRHRLRQAVRHGAVPAAAAAGSGGAPAACLLLHPRCFELSHRLRDQHAAAVTPGSVMRPTATAQPNTG
jgi:hypothetical protein